MRRHAAQGFTLVELMVALLIMALMAVLSWQGLDGMMRTLQSTTHQADQVLSLNAALTQWQTDLDALIETTNTTALDWDGNTLRMTRTAPSSSPGYFVVTAWTQREGQWQRWQSAPLSRVSDWQAAWQAATSWGQGTNAQAQQQAVVMAQAEAWQLFYYRDNAWTNSLSSAATAAASSALTPAKGSAVTGAPITASTSTLPQAVKLILTLSKGHTLQGTLTQDWVRPVVGGGKS